jgi:hypothetical protein
MNFFGPRSNARRLAHLAMLCASQAQAAPVIAGLDHIPVAVSDLALAQADFARLGFTLKPGRPHPNGISNAHIKFADHTEIELITAANPTDPLALEYSDFLKAGEGAAFWSLYAPSLPTLTTRLAALALAPQNDGEIVTFSQAQNPHRLFFASREPSPTDKPAYFDHPNTAYHLAGIWLTPSAIERNLAEHFGAIPAAGPACAPFAPAAQTLVLPGGDEIHLVPQDPHRAPDREILGVTVLVHSLTALRHTLHASHVAAIRHHTCPQGSLWVRPQEAHGVWVEFMER